jgi:hypothetical protein
LAVFKTDLDEPYVIQMRFLAPSGQSRDLNPNAILDLDWRVVDANGAMLQGGFQKSATSWANAVNLGVYRPKRGEAQRLIIELNQDLVEPEGTHVILEVNSTEDPEGKAFAYCYVLIWSVIVAFPGLILLVLLFTFRYSPRGMSARIP